MVSGHTSDNEENVKLHFLSFPYVFFKLKTQQLLVSKFVFYRFYEIKALWAFDKNPEFLYQMPLGNNYPGGRFCMGDVSFKWEKDRNVLLNKVVKQFWSSVFAPWSDWRTNITTKYTKTSFKSLTSWGKKTAQEPLWVPSLADLGIQRNYGGIPFAEFKKAEI